MSNPPTAAASRTATGVAVALANDGIVLRDGSLPTLAAAIDTETGLPELIAACEAARLLLENDGRGAHWLEGCGCAYCVTHKLLTAALIKARGDA